MTRVPRLSFQTLELLTECLAALGQSRMAKSFLVARILSEVSALAEALCRAIHVNCTHAPGGESGGKCQLFGDAKKQNKIEPDGSCETDVALLFRSLCKLKPSEILFGHTNTLAKVSVESQ